MQAREAYERAKLRAGGNRGPGSFRRPDRRMGRRSRDAGACRAGALQPGGSLQNSDRCRHCRDRSRRVRPGEGAVISCMAFPGMPCPGIVHAVSPVIDLKSRMMRATIELSATRGDRRASQVPLRPGMFASVLIETDRLQGRLLVPREALLVRDLRQLVFTMEHGLAKWHYVETGRRKPGVRGDPVGTFRREIR